MSANLIAQNVSYGAIIGETGVTLNPIWQAQFYRDVAVHPLPTSSTRVVGLLQLRGEVIPVFDPTDAGNLSEGRTSTHNVLVLLVDNKLLGIVVKYEPKPVELGQPCEVHRPKCVFEQALFDPTLASDDSAMVWWRLDAAQFFEQLSKEKSIA